MKVKPQSVLLLLTLLISTTFIHAQMDDDFTIQTIDDQSDPTNNNHHSHNHPSPNQQQQQYQQAMSRKRTACLILSRYHSNEFSDQIQSTMDGLTQDRRQNYINKIYSRAIEVCEPVITEDEVMNFFTQNQADFNPSSMFYIFENFDYRGLVHDIDEFTPNQEEILKFIKHFDDEMAIKKEEKENLQMESQTEEGVEIFFIPVSLLSSQAKYVYVVIVLVIFAGALQWGFGQLGQKPQKKENKRRKKEK